MTKETMTDAIYDGLSDGITEFGRYYLIKKSWPPIEAKMMANKLFEELMDDKVDLVMELCDGFAKKLMEV